MNYITNNLILELHVPDLALAQAFYSCLGFSKVSYEPPSSKSLGYLVLRRTDASGSSLINFYGGREDVARHAHFGVFPSETPRGYGVEITLPVADVVSLWNSVSIAVTPSAICQELRLMRWGKKDFRLVDPFGFYLRFTELVDWGQ